MELRDSDLVLRAWTEDDVPALVDACNDPEITRWIPVIPSPYTEEDALAFVRGEVLAPTPSTRSPSLATTRSSARSALGVNSHDYRGRIGYWVAAPARGHGSARARCDCSPAGRSTISELRRLELITDPDNVGSQRVAEKVGFTREGVLRSASPASRRTHSRLGDVLAATRRASRVTLGTRPF